MSAVAELSTQLSKTNHLACITVTARLRLALQSLPEKLNYRIQPFYNTSTKEEKKIPFMVIQKLVRKKNRRYFAYIFSSNSVLLCMERSPQGRVGLWAFLWADQRPRDYFIARNSHGNPMSKKSLPVQKNKKVPYTRPVSKKEREKKSFAQVRDSQR